MQNDSQLKVTCLTNENRKDEFHFDYYDKDGSIVGTVAVDENGKLGWSIWDLKYQDNILSTASYIFGLKIENTMAYILSAKEPVPIRWDRAQQYIEQKGLVVNYVDNRNFAREFGNGFIR